MTASRVGLCASWGRSGTILDPRFYGRWSALILFRPGETCLSLQETLNGDSKSERRSADGWSRSDRPALAAQPTPPSVSSVTLSMDPQNFDMLLLNVTFSEVLATLSPAALFSVVDKDRVIAGPFTVTLTTPSTVILPLAAETPPGTYRLICPDPGVSDLAGNSVAVDYLFTIQ